MALEKSEAVILKMFNWSESSRTVVFFTDRFGRLALVDRGGRSLKSKRGRLQALCHLEITFYQSQRETSGYLSDCEFLEEFSIEQDGSLGRLAYSSAALELLNLLLPEEEAHADMFRYLLAYLRKVSQVSKQFLPAVFLTCFLRIMSQLGYHPSVAYCTGCNRESEKIDPEGGRIMFSAERGGVVCRACQKAGEDYIGLSPEQLRLLRSLQRSSLDEAAQLPISFDKATALTEVLTRFLKYNSGLIKDIKSLEFLGKLKASSWH